MLSPEAFETYLAPLAPDLAEAIRAMRKLIQELAPGLVEEIDDGKWFGGLLTYNTQDGIFMYALGPRSGGVTFHMMPYYGSKELQSRNQAALKPLLTGKSCIRFKTLDQLPEDAIRDILSTTEPFAQVARQTWAARKK